MARSTWPNSLPKSSFNVSYNNSIHKRNTTETPLGGIVRRELTCSTRKSRWHRSSSDCALSRFLTNADNWLSTWRKMVPNAWSQIKFQ